MLNENFVYLALACAILGYGSYIVGTWRGTTKPNRVSWSIWALAAIVTLLAQTKLHGGTQLLYTLMQVILPGSIFLASFHNPKAYWKLTKLDVFCGVLAGIGLILLTTHQTATVSLWLGIATDFFASIPTLRKCYTDPQTESWFTYTMAIISSLITVLTVQPWLFVNYSFALYVAVVNVAFVSLILVPRRRSSS